jgi:hypothetical protein
MEIFVLLSFKNICKSPYFTRGASLIFAITCFWPVLMGSSKPIGSLKDIFEHLLHSSVSNEELICIFTWRMTLFKKIVNNMENIKRATKSVMKNFSIILIKILPKSKIMCSITPFCPEWNSWLCKQWSQHI